MNYNIFSNFIVFNVGAYNYRDVDLGFGTNICHTCNQIEIN